MDTLFTTPLFSGLTRRERTAVERLGTVVTLLDGREVASEGERGRQFGVVISGELRVTRDGVEIARLREGDAFGEISLILGPIARQTATVEAMGTATALVLSRVEFDALCDAVPAFAARVHLLGLKRLAHAAA